jgi:hypothetical protein
MSNPQNPVEPMQDALIRLAATNQADAERAIREIEAAGGRVLHSFPPRIIMASVPSDRIGEIREMAGVQSADTDEIGDERLVKMSGVIRSAAMVWNDHLKRKRSAPEKPDPSLGLSWDAPSRLPPDPPPDVMEKLRRRERDAGSEE